VSAEPGAGHNAISIALHDLPRHPRRIGKN
jgi:hypothetical protein